MKIKSIQDVVDWRLCIGCGACAYICTSQSIRLVDFLTEGIRPVIDSSSCLGCRECLDVCPSARSDFIQSLSEGNAEQQETRSAFSKEWGPVLEIWEGYATDPQIRFEGSSGGALTALSAYCIEVLGMHGVLHVGEDPEDPLRNRTRLSRTRNELLAAMGSRYSPGSVCNGLDIVESAPTPCVVIGRPAEIVAVRNACRLRPSLESKVGATFSFFCAESPSSAGTVALLDRLGVQPASLATLRYRGKGWPGHFAPTKMGASTPHHKLTYGESWGFLQSYRPWSTHLWPDGSGELADVSCGDPWYEKPSEGNPGYSLVVARTELGRKLVQGAIASGYLSLRSAEPWKLAQSQTGLLEKKGAIHGRRLALRLLRLPVTDFPGLDLKHCWRALNHRQKAKAFFGTLRRIFGRKLYRRHVPDASGSKPVASPIDGSAVQAITSRQSTISPST